MSEPPKAQIPLSDRVDTPPIKHNNRFEGEGDEIALRALGEIPDTKLLITFEGRGDGSTDFSGMDLSDDQNTITGVSTAQIDTAFAADGVNSLLLNGSSDFITVPMSEDFDFKSNDFCIEMKVRPTDTPTFNAIFIAGNTAGSDYNAAIYTKHSAASGNMFAVVIEEDGTSRALLGSAPQTLNVMQHVTLFRIGDTVYLAKEGVIIGSVALTPGVALRVPTETLKLGTDGAGNEFKGNMDMIRIVNGDGVYSPSGFTPPTDFTLSTASPSTVSVWISFLLNAVIDMSTVKCWMFKDGVVLAATDTDVQFKYAVNNGPLSSAMTLEALRGEGELTITDDTNSFKAAGIYASDGITKSKSTAWLEVEVVSGAAGGGGQPINGGIINV